MLTIKPIASGEEIFNDYGELPRSDLLRRYGYITENYKIYDEVEVYAEDIIRLVRNHSQLQQCSLDERVRILFDPRARKRTESMKARTCSAVGRG